MRFDQIGSSSLSLALGVRSCGFAPLLNFNFLEAEPQDALPGRRQETRKRKAFDSAQAEALTSRWAESKDELVLALFC